MGFLSSILCCLGEKKSSESSAWDKQLTENHYLRDGVVHSNSRRHRVQSHSNSTPKSTSYSNSSSCDYRYSSHSPISIQETNSKHKGVSIEGEVDTHIVKDPTKTTSTREDFILQRKNSQKQKNRYNITNSQEGHNVSKANDSGPILSAQKNSTSTLAKSETTSTRYSDSIGREHKLLVDTEDSKEDTHLDESINNINNNSEEMAPYVGPSKPSQVASYTHDSVRQFGSRNNNTNNNNNSNNRYNGNNSGGDTAGTIQQQQQSHNDYNPETKVDVVTVSRSATSEDSDVSDTDEIGYQTSQQQQMHQRTGPVVIDESAGNGDVVGTQQAYHVSTTDSPDMAIENDNNERLDKEQGGEVGADADEEEEEEDNEDDDDDDDDDDNGEEPIPYTDYDYNMIPNYEESGAFIDLTELQPDQYHAPGYSTLLPPREKRFQNRKCLVLDLDETLVHSSFKYLHSADFILPVDIDNQIHNVYVIKRPGVDEFLKKVGELYEVVVFTASVSRYGDPLLEKLDIYHSVHHRLFREACYNYEGNYIKNLSQIGRPLSEIIILDNSPASYIFHPQHAIPISSWFSDTHDNELLDIIPLLEDLAKENVLDVGKVLDVSI